MRRRMLDFAEFDFDTAAVVAVFLRRLVVLTECCEEREGVFLTGAFLAAGLRFADAEDAGFLEAGLDEVVPVLADCANKVQPGHRRQVETRATRIKVPLSSIALRSNQPLPIALRRACRNASKHTS